MFACHNICSLSHVTFAARRPIVPFPNDCIFHLFEDPLANPLCEASALCMLSFEANERLIRGAITATLVRSSVWLYYENIDVQVFYGPPAVA